jgi:hypothetical protein
MLCHDNADNYTLFSSDLQINIGEDTNILFENTENITTTGNIECGDKSTTDIILKREVADIYIQDSGYTLKQDRIEVIRR